MVLALVAEIRTRDGEGNTVPDHLYLPVARAARLALSPPTPKE